MSDTILQVGLVMFAYLLGSLPFGFWITKLAKVNWKRVFTDDMGEAAASSGLDKLKRLPARLRSLIAKLKNEDWSCDVRNRGSGSTGYTNVKRLTSAKWGYPVLVLDIAKGAVPALLARHYVGVELGGWCMYFAALGHAKSWYFFIQDHGVFSGGKSVATTLGGLIVVSWPLWELPLLSLLVYYLVKKRTKYVSLGSMAGMCVPFIYSMVFGMAPFWKWLYLFQLGLVVYNHRRNIASLIQGTESKDGEAATYEEEGVSTVVFVAHPITLADYSQTPLSAWLPWLVNRLSPKAKDPRSLRITALIERAAAWVASLGAVMENAKITGIETTDGHKARVLIFSVPLLPWQIKDKRYARRLDRRLKSAVVLAERRGASFVGFGALTSSAAKGGGRAHQAWAIMRRLKIVIDNGAANTAACVVKLIKRVSSPRPLSEMVFALVGASGAIGYVVTKYLRGKTKHRIAIGHTSIGKMEGLDDGAEKTLDLTRIAEANVVVLATSAEKPVINADSVGLLKEHAIVADVGVPANFDDSVLETRPDLRDSFFRCGLVKLPGANVQCNMNFHMGHIVVNGKEVQLFPACLAQVVILGITGRKKYASQGIRIDTEAIDFFSEQMDLLGFEVVISSVAERTLFSGEK